MNHQAIVRATPQSKPRRPEAGRWGPIQRIANGALLLAMVAVLGAATALMLATLDGPIRVIIVAAVEILAALTLVVVPLGLVEQWRSARWLIGWAMAAHLAAVAVAPAVVGLVAMAAVVWMAGAKS